MSEAESYSMGLHLPGLLQILGEHLYSDPRVALREAVQNAHDSCQRRQVEAGEADYEPWIQVLALPEQQALEIQDNGSGLTREEVHQFLATIGRSYTGELRQQLELGDLETAQSLIGQFGLGLLSGFLLAREVTLTTRSWRPGSPTLRWTSQGGQSYELQEVETGEVDLAAVGGSTLRFQLKSSALYLLETEPLEQVLHLFSDFLTVPVSVGEDRTPLNLEQAPWHYGGEEADYREFVRRRFGVEPLTVLPLQNAAMALGHDQVTIPLAGVLFVPPGSVTSLQEFGDVAVYVRRMFICERDRDLLPPWARFVRGVVESPRLRPTVSRESLRQDEFFQQVRQGLGKQLLQHMTQLAHHHPDVWKEVVWGHNDLLKGWAVKEPALFEAVADLVHFTTSRGRLSLPEIRQVTQDRLYYYSDESGSNQEKMLHEASGLLVIDASHFAEEAFLKRYEARGQVRLEQLQPGAQTFFRATHAGSLVQIVQYLQRLDVECRVVDFEPQQIPALLVYPPAHDQVKRVKDVVQGGTLSGPLMELMEDYLERRTLEGADASAVLHLNAGNPLLRQLEQVGPQGPGFAPALDLILQSARFFAGKDLSPQEARGSYESAMQSLHALLTERTDPPP